MKRLAIITGASKGIGRETALLLAGAGCDLLLCGRDSTAIEAVRAKCDERGAKASTFSEDLTRRGSPRRVAELAHEMGEGKFLIAINNAGYASFGDFATMAEAELEQQVATNLTVPTLMCRALIPVMLARGGGQIINVASIGAVHPFGAAAAYCASKAGLAMLGKCLLEAYRRQGIRLTTVLPGSVDTPLWDSMESTPSRSEMLRPLAVAEVIRDLVLLPPDRNVDEIQILPPDGIL